MHQLSCPNPVCTWYSSFLKECMMALSFDGASDFQRPVSTGIPQGSLASPILFLLYLRPLFNALNNAHPNVWTLSYIDDVTYVVQGRTRVDNARALKTVAKTVFDWADNNAVTFDITKTEMLHFHKARQDNITNKGKIKLPHGTIVSPGMRM